MKNHQPDDVMTDKNPMGKSLIERSLTHLTFIHPSGRVIAGAAWPFEEDEFLGNLEKTRRNRLGESCFCWGRYIGVYRVYIKKTQKNNPRIRLSPGLEIYKYRVYREFQLPFRV